VSASIPRSSIASSLCSSSRQLPAALGQGRFGGGWGDARGVSEERHWTLGGKGIHPAPCPMRLRTRTPLNRPEGVATARVPAGGRCRGRKARAFATPAVRPATASKAGAGPAVAGSPASAASQRFARGAGLLKALRWAAAACCCLWTARSLNSCRCRSAAALLALPDRRHEVGFGANGPESPALMLEPPLDPISGCNRGLGRARGTSAGSSPSRMKSGSRAICTDRPAPGLPHGSSSGNIRLSRFWRPRGQPRAAGKMQLTAWKLAVGERACLGIALPPSWQSSGSWDRQRFASRQVGGGGFQAHRADTRQGGRSWRRYGPVRWPHPAPANCAGAAAAERARRPAQPRRPSAGGASDTPVPA